MDGWMDGWMETNRIKKGAATMLELTATAMTLSRGSNGAAGRTRTGMADEIAGMDAV